MGVKYLFFVDMEYLLNLRTWLERFTQAAWSTGAGWALLMTYAIYTKPKDAIGLNEAGAKMKTGRWYNVLIYINPFIVITLFVWLLYQSIISDIDNWWNPFKVSSTGTMVVQWIIVLLVLIAANRWLARYFNPDNNHNK